MRIQIVLALLLSSFLTAQPDIKSPKKFKIVQMDGHTIIMHAADGQYNSFDELPESVRNEFLRSSVTQSQSRIAQHSRPMTTFIVSDPSDLPDANINDAVYSPPTLRSAIQNANKLGGSHSISFSSGITTIKPATELPWVTAALVIDGTTGSGKIILDGSASTATTGLSLTKTSKVTNMIFKSWKSLGLALTSSATNSTIQRNEFTLNRVGLNINAVGTLVGGDLPEDRNYAYGNTNDGIDLVYANDNILINNFCGTKDGITASPNIYNGIYVLGQRNKLKYNVLSGNMGSGLEIGEYSINTLVEDNLIGVNYAGTSRLPNTNHGISTGGDKDSIIKNVISGNGWGITVSGYCSQTYIAQNTIGSNKSLDSLFGNSYGGLYILGEKVVIDSNIISCNGGTGVYISGNGGVVVKRNKIGTDPTGMLDWGNGGSGMLILNDKNVVGGPSPDDRNIISGNTGDGIDMQGLITFSIPGGSTPNYVQGNFIRNNIIGASIDGESALPNKSGISMLGHIDSNFVRDNIISGNLRHGLLMRRFSTGNPTRNVFTNNGIGVKPSGIDPLPNDSAGVMIDDAGENLFGGITEPEGNIVAYNGYNGIVMKAGSGFFIQRNSIHHNRGLAIDLGADGPSVNDNTDSDGGANNLQNFPVITFIKVNGGNTTVTGILKSAPLKSYKIQFYSHDKPDSTGFGEGDLFHKTETVNTDSTGIAQFVTIISGAHRRVVATATDPNGNTSEFSKSPIIVNSNGDASDNNAVDGFADTGGPPVNGAPEVTLRAALQTAQHLKGEDYISFDIPGNLSTNFISPATALPSLDFSGVTIDGTTQSGFSFGNNKIVLNGSSAGDADGLQINGSQSTIKALDIQNFKHNGISVNGNDARIENVRLVSNTLNGIYASNNLHLKGKIFALNTGGGNGVSCSSNNQNGGIYVNNILYADSVEATNNCGSGIRSENGSIIITGSVVASNNSEDGIRASGHINIVGSTITAQSNKHFGFKVFTGNIYLKSTSVQNTFTVILNANGNSGLYAQQGAIVIEGKAQINNNGPQTIEQNFIGDAGIYGEKYIQTDEVEVNSNCGYGMFSPAGEVFIRGNAVINGNERLGILCQNNLRIFGIVHSISDNKEEAIYAPNGNVDIRGKVLISNNNKKNCSENPERWFPKDSERFTSFGEAGGIGCRSVTLNDADIIGNCGAGISSGLFVNISGRTSILRNTGNGIQTRNVHVAGGRICDNDGYGIRLWGNLRDYSAGFLNLGSVQVCGNGLGGIKGVKEKEAGLSKITDVFRQSASTSTSNISGSSIINNKGNGIEFDSFSQLTISKSNISGNTALSVKNIDTNIVINAQNIWWGNASGAGNSVTAGVNTSNWKTSPVSLTVSHSDDSTFNTSGSADSVYVIVRNWLKSNDSILVNIAESRGWLQSPASVVIVTKDSIPGLTNVLIKIPANALPGDSTVVHITAQSLLDSTAKDEDSFIVLSYKPALVRVLVLPDSVKLLKGDSVQFIMNGYDQANKPFEVKAQWSTTGGTIDSLGAYRADTTLGSFLVTGKDTLTGLSAKAKVVIVNSLTTVAKEQLKPITFSLEQNFPNPFNPTTKINYQLPINSFTTLKIYDLLGREVAILVNEHQRSGNYSVELNSSRLKMASGVYFYQLEAGSFVNTRKMLLLK